MIKHLKNKGVNRESFLKMTADDLNNHQKNITKINLSFDGEYILLRCPDCNYSMNLTPIIIRDRVMDIGTQCPNCKKQRFLVKLRFDREFNSN